MQIKLHKIPIISSNRPIIRSKWNGGHIRSKFKSDFATWILLHYRSITSQSVISQRSKYRTFSAICDSRICHDPINFLAYCQKNEFLGLYIYINREFKLLKWLSLEISPLNGAHFGFDLCLEIFTTFIFHSVFLYPSKLILTTNYQKLKILHMGHI